MESNNWSGQRYERSSRFCGLLVVVIGGVALIGWLTGSALLKGVGSGYIAMAPNTSVVFILLGLLLATFKEKSHRRLILVRLGAVLTLLLVSARLSEYLTGADLRVDRWFFRVPA